MTESANISLALLLAGTLAVWRLTHLLWGEDGPFDLLVRLRRAAGTSFMGRLMDCFYCLSLWVAAPVAWLLGASWKERTLLWLSFSGGAVLVERITSNSVSSQPIWRETFPTNNSLNEGKDE